MRKDEKQVEKQKQNKEVCIKEQKVKTEKGITILALVITIIVLLILAGVTIATLTGENGILTRASEASKETDIASVKEQAQLDITNWVAEEIENGRNGIVCSWENVKTILDTSNPDTNNRYYIEVTAEGVRTQSGNIVPIEELYTNEGIGMAINTDKYGQKVTNYTVQAGEMTTDVWRLFYQDSNYTYIITDESVGSYRPSNYYSSYTNGSMVSTIGQRLNPMLLEAGTFFTETNTNNNIRMTAWLTDTSETGMWNAYKNSDAIFAIGGPTIELYVASFNATASESEAITITLGVGEYGYTRNNIENGQLHTKNHGIYNIEDSIVLIASPSGVSGATELSVNGNIGNFSNIPITLSCKVRPIVCIPTSVFNSKYLSSLVDE